MTKPIILHVTPSLMIGGAEKLLVDLLTNFVTNPNNKFEHQIAYFQTGPYLNQIEKLGIKCHLITGIINHYDPICLWKLLKLIKQISPTQIHAMLWTANFYAVLIGKILKIPIICAIHSKYNSGNHNYDHFIKKIIDQIFLKWADKIVVVSAEIKTKFANQSYGIDTKQLILINNGVIIPKTTLNKRLHNKQDFVIGHIGRFVPVKNQTLLIHSLTIIRNQIPNFKVIIIGHGPLQQELKNLVQRLDLAKHVNFINSHTPHQYYPLFDCFVLPSHQEGQSIALLEAMSWGITPIITNSHTSHDIIKHLENGLICKPNDMQDLAQKIISIYLQPAIKAQLAQAAYQTVQNFFNLTHTADQYLKLYLNK